MPLPQDLAEFCIDLDVGPGEICITLPGGARVCASVEAEIVDPSSHVKALLAQANAALTPLKPTFDIIEALLSVKACIEAVPKIFADTPPNPSAVVQCIPDLVRKIEALLRLLPQFSIPLMIIEIIDALILFVQGIKNRVRVLIDKLNRILAAEQRAASLPSVQLQTIVDCARGNLDVELVNLNESLTPINRLINIVNALMDLAGLDCIPTLNDISALAEPILDALDAVIELLKNLRDLISVPDLEFGDPGSFEAICDIEAPQT